MKRGCGFILVVWLALVGAYGYVAWQRIHELFPAAMIGILGGTFGAMLVASFTGLFTGARDRAALRRAINAEAAQDGRLEAASGAIRPIGAALEAPFTGRPCVAYEYDIRLAGGEQSAYAGVALAPATNDTIRGSVRVLGWAMLDQFPPENAAAIDRGRGARYLQSATLEPLGLTSIISTFRELLSDDDGSIRKDFRIGADGFDLEGRTIKETIVPVGAVITILGRWSEEKRGFAPAGGTSINRVFPGDLESTRRQVGGAAVKTFFIGLALFLALHAILVPMYFLAPGKGSPQSRPAASARDERDRDRQTMARLMAGAAATLAIHGATPSGDHRVSYHLEHLEEGWRIKREWFPDLR